MGLGPNYKESPDAFSPAEVKALFSAPECQSHTLALQLKKAMEPLVLIEQTHETGAIVAGVLKITEAVLRAHLYSCPPGTGHTYLETMTDKFLEARGSKVRTHTHPSDMEAAVLKSAIIRASERYADMLVIEEACRVQSPARIQA